MGGANSQQAHDVVMTSMRRNNVASTSFRRHVPTRFLINQCQIITILILKSDIIENSRIELREIVLPVPSNQIKLHLLLFYPSTWYICDFFPFHIEIEGKGGWIIGGGGGGGAMGMLAPPPKLLGGGLAPPPPPPGPPLPTPMVSQVTQHHCTTRPPSEVRNIHVVHHSHVVDLSLKVGSCANDDNFVQICFCPFLCSI